MVAEPDGLMEELDIDTLIVNVDELLASLLPLCTQNNELLTNELTFENHLLQIRSTEHGIDEETCFEMFSDEKNEEFINKCA